MCRNKIIHYLIQVSLIWRVHVLQERSEIQEMDLC